ncbi:hypothetical protein SOPP22_02955 [Shewanella sp. OPT22]|nr:hypothetical protein SOPP22_02955 [Shewanella sp. OPT22]
MCLPACHQPYDGSYPYPYSHSVSNISKNTVDSNDEDIHRDNFQNVVPLTPASTTRDSVGEVRERSVESAKSNFEEAKKNSVDIARKSFLFRMIAIPFVLLGVGLSIGSVVASGGAALPIAIGVIVGSVALLFAADSITALIDWRLKNKSEEGEGLTLGADSIGNIAFYLMKACGIEHETAFKWARRISIPKRVILTVANLTFGAPGAGLDFALSNPNKSTKLLEEVIKFKAECEKLEASVRDLNTEIVVHTEALKSKAKNQDFDLSNVPLDPVIEKLEENERLLKTAKEALDEAKRQLKKAEINVAKKRFWEKLATSALLIVGASMAVFGTISSGGIIGPLAFLTMGMLSISLADTGCALFHWQSIKRGGDGLPFAENSAANGMHAIAKNFSSSDSAACTHAQRFSNFIHVPYPIFQLWPQAQLPDDYHKAKSILGTEEVVFDRVSQEEYEHRKDVNELEKLRKDILSKSKQNEFRVESVGVNPTPPSLSADPKSTEVADGYEEAKININTEENDSIATIPIPIPIPFKREMRSSVNQAESLKVLPHPISKPFTCRTSPILVKSI